MHIPALPGKQKGSGISRLGGDSAAFNLQRALGSLILAFWPLQLVVFLPLQIFSARLLTLLRLYCLFENIFGILICSFLFCSHALVDLHHSSGMKGDSCDLSHTF